MRNSRLVLLVGMAATTACRSQRPAVALPASPQVQVAARQVSDSMQLAQSLSCPKPPTVQAVPRSPAPTRRAQSMAVRRHAFPMQAARPSRWEKPGSVHPATRRHDPRPMYFLSLAVWVTLGATVLLGLLIAGILTSPLALAILLGLLALPVLAIDIFAIILWRDALNDLAKLKSHHRP